MTDKDIATLEGVLFDFFLPQSLLAGVLVLCKLLNIISWKWVWVISPLWFPSALFTFLGSFVLLVNYGKGYGKSK